MNTLNNEYAKEKKKEDTNVSLKVDENWRTSFALYKSLVDEAKLKLINDKSYKDYIEAYYNNADYVKSITKMVDGFWGTEEGWMYCKKHRKGNTINMYSALKKNLDDRKRIVYKPFIGTKTNEVDYTKTNMKLLTKVPLHNELQIVDAEGTLNDGTFIKEGYRYYFSQEKGSAISVPPGASPKPEGDGFEYSYSIGDWYEAQ